MLHLPRLPTDEEIAASPPGSLKRLRLVGRSLGPTIVGALFLAVIFIAARKLDVAFGFQ